MIAAIRALLALGVLTTAAGMLWAGEPGRLGWWALAVPFLLLGAAPYAVLNHWAAAHRDAPRPRLLLLVASIVFTGFAVAAIATMWLGPPDAQAGLVFVVVPVYQGMALLPTGWLVRRLAAVDAAS